MKCPKCGYESPIDSEWKPDYSQIARGDGTIIAKEIGDCSTCKWKRDIIALSSRCIECKKLLVQGKLSLWELRQ